MVRSWGGNKDLPKLSLSIDTYKETVTTLQVNETLFADSLEHKIFENYKELFKSFSANSHLNVITRDMNEYYLDSSKRYLPRLNNRYLFGASINEGNITAYFSNQPYHTSPITLNLLHNAILRTISKRNVSIKIFNKPLSYKAESKMMILQAGNNMGFQLAFNIGFAMAFVASFFIITYIKEKVTKVINLNFEIFLSIQIFSFIGKTFAICKRC